MTAFRRRSRSTQILHSARANNGFWAVPAMHRSGRCVGPAQAITPESLRWFVDLRFASSVTVSRRSRRQARHAPRVLAPCGRGSPCDCLRFRRASPVPGNPARTGTRHLALFNDSRTCLLVRDAQGEYRTANAEEVLKAARQVVARRVCRGTTLSSPRLVRDFLFTKLSEREHEVFVALFAEVASGAVAKVHFCKPRGTDRGRWHRRETAICVSVLHALAVSGTAL